MGDLNLANVQKAIIELATTTDSQVKTFQTQTLNNYRTLYDKVKAENDRIENTYNKIQNEHSADVQKSKYVNLSEAIIKNVYTYSFWIYMVLAIVLCVFVYNHDFSNIIKVVLFIVILGFPFYIYFLENLTYTVSIYLYNIIISISYNNGYSNTNIEYAGQATNELMAENAKSPPLSLT